MQRTFFQAILPAHPEYGALTALRDAAHLRTLGEHEEAFRRIESTWISNQSSAVLASEMIRAYAERQDLESAEEVLATFEAAGLERAIPHVANTLVDVLIDSQGEREKRRALQLLRRNRAALFGQDAIDAAILARRARDSHVAHRYFERAGDTVYADARAILEFAQTKIWLSGNALRNGQHESRRRLLNEARALLERVLQLDASPARHAWAWRELARTRNWLRAPTREVEDAYLRAIEILPSEPLFRRELQKLQAPRR